MVHMKGRQRRPNRHPGGLARTRARSTIRDVARTAGVSTATISRFFNQPEKLSAKTWSRVQSAINLHHYVADGQAGGLASPTLAHSGPHHSDHNELDLRGFHPSHPADGPKGRLYRSGRRIGVLPATGSDSRSPGCWSAVWEGLILTGAERNPELYEKISRNHVPFVVTWKSTRRTDLPLDLV